MTSRQPPRSVARRDGSALRTDSGREAQRRRTRRAIVDAAQHLLSTTETTPTVDLIAETADVSRRTVYLHFPTLDQLLLDAALGALSDSYVGSRLEHSDAGLSSSARGAHARVDALIDAILDDAERTLPLGRRIIQLTVAASPSPTPDADGPSPRRGQRRTGWLEAVIEPLSDVLTAEQRERLISGLALVIGFEAMVVLRDVRGLDVAREKRTTAWAAHALIDSILDEAGDNHQHSKS